VVRQSFVLPRARHLFSLTLTQYTHRHKHVLLFSSGFGPLSLVLWCDKRFALINFNFARDDLFSFEMQTHKNPNYRTVLHFKKCVMLLSSSWLPCVLLVSASHEVMN
jgi:hypothetical protein